MSKFWEKKNINLLNSRMLLVPINLHNLHWALVAVSIHERKMDYYDSLRNESEGFRVMNELSTIFSEYLKRNKHKEEEAIFFNDENCKRPGSTTQTDEENKLSYSFLSNISYIEDAHKQSMLPSKLNVKSNFSSDVSDSENDLQMISSFWNFRIPHVLCQNNGSDCGVYMLKFIQCLCRKERIDFTQEDINYDRYNFAIQLLEKNRFFSE